MAHLVGSAHKTQNASHCAERDGVRDSRQFQHGYLTDKRLRNGGRQTEADLQSWRARGRQTEICA